MNKLEGILRDYRRREYRKRHNVPMVEKIKRYDLIGRIDGKIKNIFNSINSVFSDLKIKYKSNPKFYQRLLSSPQILKYYKNYDITGPKTLKDLYKHFELTKEQIEEIQNAFPFISDVADFYGASYEYISAFKLDIVHQRNWCIFVDGIPQFHLMGNLWTLSIADDGVNMKGKNIAIYINPENINLVKAVTKVRAIDLIGE